MIWSVIAAVCALLCLLCVGALSWAMKNATRAMHAIAAEMRENTAALAREEEVALLEQRIERAASQIKTAIGSLDDPTGPHVVEDVRQVRDVVLLDALGALQPVMSKATPDDGGTQ